MQKHWLVKAPPKIDQVQLIQQTFKVSELMAALLAQRGLTTQPEIRSYFNPDLSQLNDPFLFKNMEAAVERIEKAVQHQEHILVYGDYDVDGTTAVALTVSVLSAFTKVSYYIPDRYEEGYGISFKGVHEAHQRGAALIIALDCGIKEIDKIATARELGMDVIVCDHHTPGITVPDALVLDAKQSDCTYPYKELCGCGVGFKLLWAWLSARNADKQILLDQLDLVAIAIGADIVPVTEENRVLAKLGLQLLNQQPRPGIQAMVNSAKRAFPLTLSDVVFTIAPRINAAGRLNSGSRAVELLLANSTVDAFAIAKEIEVYNANRRELDAEITQEALELIENDSDFSNKKSTVVFAPHWHKGVVGIVASRLIETHYRPTIVLTESNGRITGSARSVRGFDVYQALLQCEHTLEQFGGHAFAAGLTLLPEQLEGFQQTFDQVVQQTITYKEETEEIHIDFEVKFSDLFISGESVAQVPRLYKMIDELEPFGPENLQPVFLVRNVYSNHYKILKDAHLKLSIFDPSCGISLDGIGFNLADKEQFVAAGCSFDVLFTLDKNTWNNQTSLQLMIKDIREA